jgi:hypothetical protein
LSVGLSYRGRDLAAMAVHDALLSGFRCPLERLREMNRTGHETDNGESAGRHPSLKARKVSHFVYFYPKDTRS